MVTIVADRIGEPDARNGFILDGFPRTVPQAVALDKMLKEKRLKLDGVIELKVDGSILQSRIENRMREAAARGETLRSDDDPEVLKRRVDAYREQTAPLVDYYRWQGTLKSVDGMRAIDEVEAAIHKALTEKPPIRKPAPKEPSPAKSSPQASAPKARAAAGKPAAKVKPKAPAKAAKPAKRRPKSPKPGPPRPKPGSGPQGAAKPASAASKGPPRGGPPPAAKLPRASPNASRG